MVCLKNILKMVQGLLLILFLVVHAYPAASEKVVDIRQLSEKLDDYQQKRGIFLNSITAPFTLLLAPSSTGYSSRMLTAQEFNLGIQLIFNSHGGLKSLIPSYFLALDYSIIAEEHREELANKVATVDNIWAIEIIKNHINLTRLYRLAKVDAEKFWETINNTLVQINNFKEAVMRSFEECGLYAFSPSERDLENLASDLDKNLNRIAGFFRDESDSVERRFKESAPALSEDERTVLNKLLTYIKSGPQKIKSLSPHEIRRLIILTKLAHHRLLSNTAEPFVTVIKPRILHSFEAFLYLEPHLELCQQLNKFLAQRQATYKEPLGQKVSSSIARIRRYLTTTVAQFFPGITAAPKPASLIPEELLGVSIEPSENPILPADPVELATRYKNTLRDIRQRVERTLRKQIEESRTLAGLHSSDAVIELASTMEEEARLKHACEELLRQTFNTSPENARRIVNEILETTAGSRTSYTWNQLYAKLIGEGRAINHTIDTNIFLQSLDAKTKQTLTTAFKKLVNNQRTQSGPRTATQPLSSEQMSISEVSHRVSLLFDDLYGMDLLAVFNTIVLPEELNTLEFLRLLEDAHQAVSCLLLDLQRTIRESIRLLQRVDPKALERFVRQSQHELHALKTFIKSRLEALGLTSSLARTLPLENLRRFIVEISSNAINPFVNRSGEHLAKLRELLESGAIEEDKIEHAQEIYRWFQARYQEHCQQMALLAGAVTSHLQAALFKTFIPLVDEPEVHFFNLYRPALEAAWRCPFFSAIQEEENSDFTSTHAALLELTRERQRVETAAIPVKSAHPEKAASAAGRAVNRAKDVVRSLFRRGDR